MPLDKRLASLNPHVAITTCVFSIFSLKVFFTTEFSWARFPPRSTLRYAKGEYRPHYEVPNDRSLSWDPFQRYQPARPRSQRASYEPVLRVNGCLQHNNILCISELQKERQIFLWNGVVYMLVCEAKSQAGLLWWARSRDQVKIILPLQFFSSDFGPDLHSTAETTEWAQWSNIQRTFRHLFHESSQSRKLPEMMLLDITSIK